MGDETWEEETWGDEARGDEARGDEARGDCGGDGDGGVYGGMTRVMEGSTLMEYGPRATLA